jgi:hypothetical protein
LGPDPIAAYLDGERQQAEVTLIEMVRGMGPTTYGEIWPNVLSRHAVRLTDLNMIAARLRKDGVLMFPEWAARQRVPSDNSRVQLGAEA